MISQGDVWWADLPDPTGSGPGFRRPVVVVQGDALNRSRIAAVTYEQPQVGQSSRQCDALPPLDRAPKGFGRQRLPDRELGQGAAHCSEWEITPSAARLGALGNRRRARPIGSVQQHARAGRSSSVVIGPSVDLARVLRHVPPPLGAAVYAEHRGSLIQPSHSLLHGPFGVQALACPVPVQPEGRTPNPSPP